MTLAVRLLGIIAVADPIKPTARQAVRHLRQIGVETVLLTGDNERTAAAVAAQLGIDHVLAGVLPSEKPAEVQRLKRKANVLAWRETASTMPRRSSRPVSELPWARVAMQTAGITLMRGDPLLSVMRLR